MNNAHIHPSSKKTSGLQNRLTVFIASCLITCTGVAANLSVLPELDEPFANVDTLSTTSPYDDLISEELSLDFDADLVEELQTIQKQVRQAYSALREGRKDEGIKKLEQAWSSQPSIPVAGVILAITYLQGKEYNSALDIAQKIQNNTPNVAEGYTLAGIAYVGLNNTKQAHVSFQKAIEVQPSNVNAGLNLATSFLNRGEPDKAKKITTELLGYNPADVKVISALAKLEFSSGNKEKAILLMNSAISNHPDQLQPYMSLAQIHLSNKNPVKALGILDKALEKFPNQVSLMEDKAVVLLQGGAPDRAISILQSAVNLSPDKASLHYNLALAYEKIKKLPQAITEINKALNLAPTHSSSKFILARLMAKTGELKAADNLIKELEISNPESANILELKGKIAATQNNLKDAITYFREATRKNPHNPLLVASLALAQFKSKDNDSGYTTLRNWISNNPEDISIRFILADRLLDNASYNEAQKYYSEILKLQPDNIIASNNIAWLFMKTGQLEEALFRAEKNYLQAPNNVFVMDTLATTLLAQGQNVRAIEILRNATKISPENTMANFHLAQAISDSNKDEAITILENLLSKPQSSKERNLAQNLLMQLKTIK